MIPKDKSLKLVQIYCHVCDKFENDLQYSSTVNDFYITYEEVNNGSGQHDIVRQEIETRV